ncbi:MAG: glycosyltransferase family 4 protein [Candidatus Bathyarchaeia archaeon]
MFVTVGRLVKQKGLRQLIEAVRVLHEHMSEANFTLLIVGSGPLRAELEEKVKEYGLNDRIKFVGQVEYEKLGRILQTADVFVFPTLEDVWGAAPLEAMAMGKPVICSKYAGVRELIRDNVNGYVVDPMDTLGMAQAMKRFIENPRLIEEMGCSAKSTMSLFTPRRAAQFLAEVVKHVYK